MRASLASAQHRLHPALLAGGTAMAGRAAKGRNSSRGKPPSRKNTAKRIPRQEGETPLARDQLTGPRL